MKGKKTALVFCLILALNVPLVFGAWIVKDIQDPESDQFRFESGIAWDGVDTLVLKDPTSETRIALRFRGLNIDRNTRINGANLSFYSITSAYPFQANSSVTIYGFAVDDVRPFDIVEPWDLPITAEYVIWNTSNVINDQRYNVSVGNILQEIISRYGYTSASKMGFMIYSVPGEQRVAYASEFGHNRGPILYIQHGETPPPPPGLPPGAEYNQTYNGYDIYGIPIYGNFTKDYLFWRQGGAVPSLRYDTVHAQPSTYSIVVASMNDASALYSGGARQITKIGNGTIYMVYHQGATRVIWSKHSDDEGVTWSLPERISPILGFGGASQRNARIAVDSNNIIHVVWTGINVTERNVFYANYTTFWSNPIGIISVGNMSAYPQTESAIAIDEADNLHLTWIGVNYTYPAPNYQVWYSNRTATNTWCDPVRISTLAGMDSNDPQVYPTITCDSTNSTHIAWSGSSDGFPDPNRQIWHSFTYLNNSWSDPVRVSKYAGMNVNIQTGASIAIGYENDNAHLTWWGMATGIGKMQIWYSSYNNTWSTPIPIANFAGMSGEHQTEPSIAVYPDETINVLWTGQSTDWPNDNAIWDKQYRNGSWGGVQRLQEENTHDLMTPNLAYSRFPEQISIGETWEAWLNGNLSFECETLECLTDLIDDFDPDPDDPEPGTWSSIGGLDRFRTKMIFVVLGLIMLMGSLLFGLAMKPSASTWIGIIFSMLVGWALLVATQTM